MVDIANYPYYSYNQAVEPLILPMKRHVAIQFCNYNRRFPTRERICISLNKQHSVDWWAREFYKYSPFENESIEENSSYHMWDHVPQTPYFLKNFTYHAQHHNISHGLTIVRKYPKYSDHFVFATTLGNHQINNFYLNEKALFEAFIVDFYTVMNSTIQDLESHKIYIPEPYSLSSNPLASLSPRQQDCIALLRQGLSAKEMGKALCISHRTVEGHLNDLKSKFEAKNRLHLVNLLQKNL